MKKLLILILLFICSAKFSNAQYYYQPYPLTSQITSNGNEWRMECSVFDSLLGNTQYYTGPWCGDSLELLNDNIGITGYTSVWVALTNYTGAVIYDAEQHLFKPVAIDSSSILNNDYTFIGSNRVSTVHKTDPFDDFYDVATHYYDLKSSVWKTVTFNGFMADVFWGDYLTFMGEGDISLNSSMYRVNPVTHTWDYFGDAYKPCDFPSVDMYADLVIDEAYDCWTGTYYGHFDINNPVGSVGFGFADGSFKGIEGRNIFYQDYNLNPSLNSINVSTPDISLNNFAAFSLDGVNVTTLNKKRNVFSVVDTSNKIITYGVYSFLQHAWKVSSDTVNYIVSDSIINGTVFFIDSSGNSYTRGYIDSIGWDNYNTQPQPIYFLQSYNTASTGNLVYIKDYSIGADSILIDYGDGLTTNRTFDYHLYKVNGHYRTTSAANFNVCVTAYQNGVASTPSCQAVNFVTALEEPVRQTPITITSKGNSNILNISNTEGHSLQVKVYDVAGRQIKSFNNTGSQLMVSLKTLSTGMYVVKVYDEQTHNIITGKFVKR